MCELHLHSCIHAASGCGEQLTREGLLSHGDVCDYRPHKCTLCLTEFAFNTKSMHDDTACPSAAVSCNNTPCKTVVQRCDLQAHSDVCPWQVVACDSVGCTESYTRSDRAGHMTAFKLRHETLLADTAKQNVSDIAALKREVAALRADSLSHKNNFVLCLDHSSQLMGVSLETLTHSFFQNGPEVSCNARFLDETTIAVRVLNCSYQWNVSMHYKCWYLKADSYEIFRTISDCDAMDTTKPPIVVRNQGSMVITFQMSAEDRVACVGDSGEFCIMFRVHINTM